MKSVYEMCRFALIGWKNRIGYIAFTVLTSSMGVLLLSFSFSIGSNISEYLHTTFFSDDKYQIISVTQTDIPSDILIGHIMEIDSNAEYAIIDTSLIVSEYNGISLNSPVCNITNWSTRFFSANNINQSDMSYLLSDKCIYCVSNALCEEGKQLSTKITAQNDQNPIQVSVRYDLPPSWVYKLSIYTNYLFFCFNTKSTEGQQSSISEMLIKVSDIDMLAKMVSKLQELNCSVNSLLSDAIHFQHLMIISELLLAICGIVFFLISAIGMGNGYKVLQSKEKKRMCLLKVIGISKKWVNGVVYCEFIMLFLLSALLSAILILLLDISTALPINCIVETNFLIELFSIKWGFFPIALGIMATRFLIIIQVEKKSNTDKEIIPFIKGEWDQ